MATIKDVAMRSETSVGTVSRYLNGYKIKELNQMKVAAAIKELNFNINTIARGLKTNKTNTIGVLIPGLSNVFSTQVISALEKKFYEYGYNIIVCDSAEDINKESEKLKLLMSNCVDGIILMPVSDSGEQIKQVIGDKIPIVQIDRLVKNIKIDGVISDNINGAYAAIENLIVLGHKRIGIIAGQKNIYTAKERLEGYLRALNDYNIEVNAELIVYTDFDKVGGEMAIKQMMSLNEPPTAIFTSNYYTTIGALKALVKSGVKIGEDVSLFGYDQTELSEVLNPPLSVVVQPMDEIGNRAAELLIKRIKGDVTGFPIIVRLKNHLIITDSIKKIL